MPEYTVVIKIPNAGNKEIPYSVQLTGPHEDHPEDYFKVEQNRLQLCQVIQNHSARQISKEQLKRLIDKWIGEIKQSRRRTTITLDLPPEVIFTPNPTAVASDFSAPTTATSTHQPVPKKPNPSIAKPKIPNPASTTTTPVANNSPLTATNTPSVASKPTSTEKKEPEPTISIEAATNEPDF